MRAKKINKNFCSSLMLPDSSGWLDNCVFYIYFQKQSFTENHLYRSYMKFDLQRGIVKPIFNLFQSNKNFFLI